MKQSKFGYRLPWLRIGAVGALILVTLLCATISIYTDRETTVMLDGQEITITVPPVIIGGQSLVPLRDLCDALGAQISWEEDTESVTVVFHGRKLQFQMDSRIAVVNRQEYPLPVPVTEITDKAFVPVRFFAEAVGAQVEWHPETHTISITSPAPRDILEDTIITDEYRLSGSPVYYNGVAVIGDVGMELLRISQSDAIEYADIVNSLAAELPDIDVYNMVVPTSSEFYAPKEVYNSYIDAVKTVYSNLELNVHPVNAFPTLMQHANEKIYFSTDHHWTQRGAYYAYQKFIGEVGGTIAPLEEFQTANIDAYRGSFINFTSGTPGTSLLSANPDLLERFLPKVQVEGKAYDDEFLESYIKDIQVVNTAFSTYESFIEGDFPITVLKTDQKNGKKLAIIKESYGNAFSTWAVNHFEEVYIIDLRKFNGMDGSSQPFRITDFQARTGFDTLLIISYPVSVASSNSRQALASFQ